MKKPASIAITFHGWPNSVFSQKVKGFLDYAGLSYRTHVPNLLTLRTRIRKWTGRMMIPVVQYGDQVLQDSAHIIDTVAADQSLDISPPGPAQKLASELLQLNADEWLIMAAMHFRWQSGPENKAFILDDFSRCMLPGAPGFLRAPLGWQVGNLMQAHLPRLGLEGEIPAAVADWTKTLLDALDATLANQPYLFGGKASHADFALYGPIYAHLWRDPAPRPMVEARANVMDWVRRLKDGDGPQGDWLSHDAVPEALAPIFLAQRRDQFPALSEISRRLRAWRANHPQAERLPERLGAIPITVSNVGGTQLGRSFSLLRLQRVQRLIDDARSAPGLGDAGIKLDAIPADGHNLAWRDYRLVYQQVEASRAAS